MKNNYLNAIRDHVNLLLRRGRTDQLIVWRVGSDEIHDPTLLARRAYGNPDYADVVMVCAGTNRISEPLPDRVIYLPQGRRVMQIRQSFLQQINMG